MTRITLGPDLRVQLERQAQAALPHECCGLIEGVRSGDMVLARALHATRNIASDMDRFEIDPAAHFSILRAARDRETEIVGCYHSHPSGAATPSTRDLENLGEEGFVWLIVAPTGCSSAELGAFVVSAGALIPIVCAEA